MRINIVISFIVLTTYVYPSFAVDIFEKFNNANTLILSEDFVKAKKILKEILIKEPDNIQIANNIAYIEAKLGNIDEAIKILRKSITSNEDVDVVYKNLTSLYAFQANILYEEALSIQETENNIHLTLVENLVTKNQINMSKKNISDIKKIPYKNKINPENVKEFIKKWSIFWQEKNYDSYFDCYEKNYHPRKFKSNSAWKSDRKNKIQNKSNIEIKISNIKVISYDNENILVQFTQSYNSDSFSDVVNKHTTIKVIEDIYKITGEYTLK